MSSEKEQKSLNVCLFSHTSQLGGSERSLLELTTELVRDYGAACTVVLPNDGPLREKLEEAGACILIREYYWWTNIPPEEEIKPRFVYSLRMVLDEIIPSLEKINPDIILTNTMVIPWGAVAALFLGKPHVWYIREFGEIDYGLKFYLPFQQTLEYIKDTSNLILTNSNAVRKKLFGDFQSENILTIYNYVDVPTVGFYKDKDDYDKKTNAVRLIISGTIAESKGIEDAILAVDELIRRKRDVELVVVGPSPFQDYLNRLKKIIRDKNLDIHIVFLPFAENIYSVIRQADIALVCSRCEPFGRVTVEAMLLGKPVIGTNSGGTPELIKEGFNGLLYEPGDYRQLANRIEYLIDNKRKIKELGENGQTFARQTFTKENYGGRIYELLNNIKNQKNPSTNVHFALLRNLMLDNIINKEEQIELLQATEQSLQKELNRIHASPGGILLKKYEKVRGLLFPFDTKRGKVYALIIKSIKTVMHEGWLTFVRKSIRAIRKGITPYDLWILNNEPDGERLKEMRIESRSWSNQPKVSIITPVYNPTQYALSQCIISVLSQAYENWELCLVDGGSDKTYVKKIIMNFAGKDNRIKYAFLSKNTGIAGNSNEALKLATGEYVGFLDHDDMIAPYALYEVVKLINKSPEVDLIYSDEDKVPEHGEKRYYPFFKPEWSLDMFLSYNYLCHFLVIRRSIIKEVGGFREGYDGAQDYDLILRIIQKSSEIKRIPKILYHWRAARVSTSLSETAKPYVQAATKKAITDYLVKMGLSGEVLDGLFLGSFRVKYQIRVPQRICIIIPTRDKVHLLRRCISSILARTEYKDYEIMIVDNQSMEPATHDYYNDIKSNDKIKILNYDKPFNYSAINNFAVKSTNAGCIVLMNNDIEVISGEWLSAMLEFAQREDVGAVGAKLYYPDNTIQHAGVIIGFGGVADHPHKKSPRSSNGYMGRINIIQNLSAVTAACLMFRRKVFEEVGGFDERLSHAFNDVDLCLKIREKGYLIVYTPYAELYHHEFASRGHEDTPEKMARYNKEIRIMKTKWKYFFEEGDPYYNPNLSNYEPYFSIRS